jgi:hypothetical protein
MVNSISLPLLITALAYKATANHLCIGSIILQRGAQVKFEILIRLMFDKGFVF